MKATLALLSLITAQTVSMSELRKQGIGGWPSANARKVDSTRDWEQAHAWLKADKKNRVIEGVQVFPMGHEQHMWERVEEGKPIGFDYGSGDRWLNFYSEAEEKGGLLYGSGVDKGGHKAGVWDGVWDGHAQHVYDGIGAVVRAA